MRAPATAHGHRLTREAGAPATHHLQAGQSTPAHLMGMDAHLMCMQPCKGSQVAASRQPAGQQQSAKRACSKRMAQKQHLQAFTWGVPLVQAGRRRRLFGPRQSRAALDQPGWQRTMTHEWWPGRCEGGSRGARGVQLGAKRTNTPSRNKKLSSTCERYQLGLAITSTAGMGADTKLLPAPLTQEKGMGPPLDSMHQVASPSAPAAP